MTGDIVGSDTVVENTWSTLACFPDRTLDAENVIWKKPYTDYDNDNDNDNDVNNKNKNDQVYSFSSHLIVSRMTNLGDTEYGPATNKQVRIRTIADCVIQEKMNDDDEMIIVEEWLMRDNAWLVMSLGYDLCKVAEEQALKDLNHSGGTTMNLISYLEPHRASVLQQKKNKSDASSYVLPPPIINISSNEETVRAYYEALFHILWEKQTSTQTKATTPLNESLSMFYDYRVTAHLTAGRELVGIKEKEHYLRIFQDGLQDVLVTVDHVAVIPFLDSKIAMDVAIRWSMIAKHGTDSKLWGTASHTPVYVLGSSHYRVINNKIREEWTVFDELAIHRQMYTGRHLKKFASSSSSATAADIANAETEEKKVADQ